ncbi:MAG: hypothetical protein HYX75_09820 [Acidobacteria bacterium]|nr:hypothetical protein [Acidobacteriota bacterium]
MQPGRTEEDKLIVGYLLGDLSPEGKEQIELRCITDDEFFERILVIEDELIDDYARVELPPVEHDLFERNFLTSPERRRKVEIAKGLVEWACRSRGLAAPGAPQAAPGGWWKSVWSYMTVDRVRYPRPPFALMAATMCIVLLGGSWLIRQHLRQRSRFDQAVTEVAALRQQAIDLQEQVGSQRARGDELSRKLRERESVMSSQQPEQELSAQPRRPSVETFSVAPLVRGAQGEPLVIHPGTQLIDLQVSPGSKDRYESFRAAIATPDGQMVWMQANIQPPSSSGLKAISLFVPADALGSGDFILTLSGRSPDGTDEVVTEYALRIVWEPARER